MKVKLGLLADHIGTLTEFANLPMPTPLAIRMKRILRVAKTEVDAYVEVQIKKAVEMGAKVDGAQLDFGDKDKRALFNKEMAPAREEEVELPTDMWSETDLAQIKEIKPAILFDLDWLIQT